MMKLAHSLAFLTILAVAAAAFTLLFWIAFALWHGTLALPFTDTVFWLSFTLAFFGGLGPALISYAKIDHFGRKPAVAQPIRKYAFGGGVGAVAIMTLGYIYLAIFDHTHDLINLEAALVYGLLALWFFATGAAAGALFGALLPIGLPTQRDAPPSARPS